MKTTKLCKDCKHFLPDTDFSDEDLRTAFGLCGRSKLRPSGEHHHAKIERIFDEGFLWWRRDCGPKGRFWEPKPVTITITIIDKGDIKAILTDPEFIKNELMPALQKEINRADAPLFSQPE